MIKVLLKKSTPILLITIFSFCVSFLVSMSSIGEQSELLVQNTLYKTKDSKFDIIIIGIDSKSIDETGFGLGNLATWSKKYWADTINNISEDGAKVIGIDIVFKAEKNFVPSEVITELKFRQALGEDISDVFKEFIKDYSGSLTPENISFTKTLEENKDKIILPILIGENVVEYPVSIYKNAIELFGYINVKTDKIGLIRGFTPNYKDFKDFGLIIAEQYLGEKLNFQDENNEVYINFYAKPNGFPIVSFVDIYRGDFEKGLFKDKIVLIGLTALEQTQDKFFTPISNNEYMPGVEFRANQIQSLLNNDYLRKQSDNWNNILTIIFGIILTTIFMYFSGIISTISLILCFSLYYLLGVYYFDKSILINFTTPLLAFTLSYILAFAYRYFISDKQGRELKSAFSKYVSEELVEKISKNPEMVKLGGEKRIVTVFFMDIKDSTSYSEKIEITKWIKQLNEYFTVMEIIIKARGGTLDKFEGDAIMGFFGAPLVQEDQVLRAFLTALDMKEALEKLHEKWSKEGLPLIEFRMGINTGEAIVGNIGSINRFDYTVMGDMVNTASRMEGSVNKTYNTTIISANFEKHCDLNVLKKYIVVREIDNAIMLGKTEATKLYELFCKSNKLSDANNNILTVYSEALNEYRNKNFEKAKTLFDSISQIDPPSKAMSERIQKIINGEIAGELDENMNYKMNKK